MQVDLIHLFASDNLIVNYIVDEWLSGFKSRARKHPISVLIDLGAKSAADANHDATVTLTAPPVETVAPEKIAAPPLKRRKAYYLQLCEDHQHNQDTKMHNIEQLK